MEELLKEVMDSMQDQVKLSKRELFLGMAAVFMSGAVWGLMVSAKQNCKHCHKSCSCHEENGKPEEIGKREECCQKNSRSRKKKGECCL